MIFDKIMAIVYFFTSFRFTFESQFNFVLFDFLELPRVDRPAWNDRIDGEELIADGAAVGFERWFMRGLHLKWCM